MLVATLGPTTAWLGREIIWDMDHFILVGYGAIPAAGVLDYDRLGQLVWPRPELRSWVAEVDRWERGTSGASGTAQAGASGWSAAGAGAASWGAAPAGAPAGSATTSRGMPGWAIALIVLGAVLATTGIIASVIVPMVIVRSAETFTKDIGVQTGVQTIQTGIEVYAAAHNGRYPPAGEVTSVGLSGYVPVWPQNPYTGLPMADARGTGNFRYVVSANRGAYILVGYGRNGKIVLQLSGGSDTTVWSLETPGPPPADPTDAGFPPAPWRAAAEPAR